MVIQMLWFAKPKQFQTALIFKQITQVSACNLLAWSFHVTMQVNSVTQTNCLHGI